MSDTNRDSVPVGAVLVVGGGIAGIQASLDLAEAGFKVYLTETKSAIGGHMAQLDKTFPTNDCAMCTISPKLVETGRHLNIDILTDTEVLAVKGEAGDFTVALRRKPRYIDLAKCTGCGDCATVCPIPLSSEYDEGLATRKAAYRLYPQAIPSAYAIEKRGVAPCRHGCPVGQRAQGYIALIQERRYEDALRVIKEDNPFPSVCGRTCHHPCEGRCARARVDGAVNIMALKRFVADWVYNQQRADGRWQMADGRWQMADGNYQPSAISPTSVVLKEGLSAPLESAPGDAQDRWSTTPANQGSHRLSAIGYQPSAKVAIVGAGPAGLTAAQDLVKMGHGVTVFEALPVAGGMMRVGIPAHRLPRDVLHRDIDDILALGVELRTNTPVRDPLRLLKEGYDAVYLATGRSSNDHRLGIEGEELERVMPAISFLRRVNLGEKVDIGQRVAVVGGGITAVDAATTALRLGASEVHLVYQRAKDELPAYPWEMAEAESENVRLLKNTMAVRVLGQDEKVVGLVCAQTGRGQVVDERGRRRPKAKPDTEFTLAVDTVITVVGQSSDLSFVDERFEDLAGDPDTLATEYPGIFAASEATRPSFVIVAIAQGHQAASSIDHYLRGQPPEKLEKPAVPVVKWTRQELAQQVLAGEIQLRDRIEPAVRPVEERITGFDEVMLGFTEEQALAEVERCLQCGICSECLECVYACQADAIDHDMVERIEEISVGAVILAPGYQAYQAELSEEYGLGRYPNVVTALQFERLLNASGPTDGHVQRPSDGETPKKIAFLQCIGSRDQTHDYCSAVCCMYATKEAIMAVEHEPDTEVHVFMMDMRSFSKGYEEYYHRARDRYGVEYTRCRISDVKENPETHNLILRYVPEVTSQRVNESTSQRVNESTSQWGTDSELISSLTHNSLPVIDEEFDMVVLSVGMEISESVRQLGRKLGVELDDYGFCHTVRFDPLQTSQPGVYAVGPFRSPKDIPETVVDASGAAAQVGGLLAASRGTLVREKPHVSERDVSGEESRVGVFVCHCGSNIGGFLDVPAVTEYAKGLSGVTHAEHLLYACSQDSIAAITERVQELGLNRAVVASCTPLTHGPLFEDSIRQAGINEYLFEMANIRNQCSWVHSDEWDVATEKAKDLVRMAVARARTLEPLHTSHVPVDRTGLVIGGGVAGMNAALALAEQGIPVHLVEREAELGGNLRNVRYLAAGNGSTSQRGDGATGRKVEKPKRQQVDEDPQVYLRELIESVTSHPLINVYLGTELEKTGGFVGNFTSTLRNGVSSIEIRHGATIVATGAREYRGPEYGYGTDPRILTQQEFEERIANSESRIRSHSSQAEKTEHGIRNTQYALPNSVVMIQCVGPAEKFCSRICCSTALKNALRLKELNPAARVAVLYKDIRTYGFHERLYTEARRQGVLFLRYDDEHRPEVVTGGQVKAWDPILGQEITLMPDLLVLSMPMVPAEGAKALGTKLKVPVDLDGWFQEAHVKLRPVDFASDGVFMAGAAHYPKLLDETIVQARAAAARAATILTKEALNVGGIVAQVNPELCVGCLTCVRVCPYGVPRITADFTGIGGILGAAFIDAAICQGCGTCVAECPARAIQLSHYRDEQMEIKINVLVEPAMLAAGQRVNESVS